MKTAKEFMAEAEVLRERVKKLEAEAQHRECLTEVLPGERLTFTLDGLIGTLMAMRKGGTSPMIHGDTPVVVATRDGGWISASATDLLLVPVSQSSSLSKDGDTWKRGPDRENEEGTFEQVNTRRTQIISLS
jgi:hypothetical protein